MDTGFRSPLIDYFRRGEAARDIRLFAARGAVAPRAQEQMALLLLLKDDHDREVAATAARTLDAIPKLALASFLARPDTPAETREYFATRGIQAALAPDVGDPDAPLLEEPVLSNGAPAPSEPPAVRAEPGAKDASAASGAAPDASAEKSAEHTPLSMLPVVERMKLALKGTREQRTLLIRDSNRLVAAAVLSSPKVTESEVEAFSKMANVSEEVLRVIGTNRHWLKSYAVVSGLTRNPKTPLAVSLQLVSRLNEKDIRMLSMERNIPEAVRLAARKFLVKGKKEG